MKRDICLKLLSIFLVVGLLPSKVNAQNGLEWKDDAFSMFIHYGLYSIPGGVWDGKPVTRGYSEQILAFGVHFMDWYETLAKDFTAKNFDAEKIVALAKTAGMRSIVITSKHHDGFCLFGSDYTTYNTVDATPAKRDIIGELSKACHDNGMRFGLYFSLIDWHYPPAMPISSHNADPITPEHHQYNLNQVRELLTKYGQVDELWFDMGSLTASQSKELYDLVHAIQPNCMVSGRLGNDYADFSVMADNEYPNYIIDKPWQTAASMFDETWGYRSWQKRGSVEKKALEKFSSLVEVVSKGGKYLLNIGPMGDGGVVPFEEDVLKEIGLRTNRYKEAIYATEAGPILDGFDYFITSKDDRNLYLFVPTTHNSQAMEVLLPPHEGKLKRVTFLKGDGRDEKLKFRKLTSGESVINLPAPSHTLEVPFRVIKLEYKEKPDFTTSSSIVRSDVTLSAKNAQLVSSHSSLDYYCGFRSIVGYKWNVEAAPVDYIYDIHFTESDVGKKVIIQTDLDQREVILKPSDQTTVSTVKSNWENPKVIPVRGIFGGEVLTTNEGWTKREDMLGLTIKFNCPSRRGLGLLYEIEVEEDGWIAMDVTYHDGLMLFIDDTYVWGNIHRPQAKPNKPTRIVYKLQKGTHYVAFKLYNRFSDNAEMKISLLDEFTLFEQPIALKCNRSKNNYMSIVVKSADPYRARPAELQNIQLVPRE